MPRCEHVLKRARLGEVEIWTSALTLAEVFKVKCGGTVAQLMTAADDQKFEDYLNQDFVVIAQVDVDTGRTARRLLRQHSPLKKFPDAIHLATAVLNSLDEFHTFDGENLLPLNGTVNRDDGITLSICVPPVPPPPAPAPMPLFDHADFLESQAAIPAPVIAPIPREAPKVDQPRG